MITGSHYPEKFDNDENLYLVKDALKVPLGFDYHPGAASILVDGDITRFPPSGIITLVDQHSSPKERAVSLYYSSRNNREFLGLELLPDSIDAPKPKKVTFVTLQAMANHREALKDAILAIEKFLGKKHDLSEGVSGDTIFGRVNFLKKVLFSPKAWFEVEKSTGVVPFTTNFIFAGSGHVGPVGSVFYTWKFNDEEIKTADPVIQKVFTEPGIYTVSLTIENSYGKDTVTFIDMVKVKGQAPEPATVKFLPFQNQIHFDDIIPKIRTPVNQPIMIEVPQKTFENKKTYAGELIDPRTNKTVDAITNYTWNLSDDLPHANTSKTKALYTVGGYYDLVLRTDTDLNAYRITTYENCIDVVEQNNLWVWVTENKQRIRSLEFGLISEVFKTSNNVYALRANDSFLDNDRQKFEFWRNNGAAPKGVSSGDGGDCLLFWATGRGPQDTASVEKIDFVNYNGFSDLYKTENPITRPWNWAALPSDKEVYFIFGLSPESESPTVSQTNKNKTTYNIETGYESNEILGYENFKNGGYELSMNPGVFDQKYNAPYGHHAAYRTAWKDNVGYILRNQTLGEHFSFQHFYKTEGTIGLPFQNIVKLPDLPGDNNKEGSLVGMSGGIYFFNNHGGSYCFNDTSGTWELVNFHNKISRKELNTLLATSDESKAYISIEDTAFFKFNEIDMSFSTFNNAPLKNQWLMKIY